MGGTPDLRIGLPTLPADLPVVGVADAVEVALRGRSFPTVPVPCDPAYSLLAQAASAFEGAYAMPNNDLRVNEATFGVRPEAAASTDFEAFAALEATLQRWPASTAGSAVDALRVDMVGPVTLALTLARTGVPLAQALDAARMALVYRAEAILARIREVEPSSAVVVMMIEPRLLGSMHPTFPLTVRQVRSLLDPVVDVLDRAATGAGLLIGVHVPGRADWRTIISSGVSLVSMPPDPSLVGWAPWVQALLDNGGYVAWGAVPVDRPLGTGEELLWRNLAATWRDLEGAGVDAQLLRARSMVGPADGLSRFDVSQLPLVVDLVDALAGRIRVHAGPSRASSGF